MKQNSKVGLKKQSNKLNKDKALLSWLIILRWLCHQGQYISHKKNNILSHSK